MDSDKQSYQNMLAELMKLRDKDYELFMDKLYLALMGEARDALKDATPAGEKRSAIWIMIKHFEEKEEFEKCADLKKLADSLN